MMTRKDWLRLGALALAGALLGLANNALHPRGIDLRIAFRSLWPEAGP